MIRRRLLNTGVTAFVVVYIFAHNRNGYCAAFLA